MSQSEVKIYGQTAGYLVWDKKDRRAVFEFEPSCQLPFAPFHIQKAVTVIPGLKDKTFKGLPSFISDSLPDAWGNKVIDTWLANENISKANFTPVDRLNYLGNRGMGALEYAPSMIPESSNDSQISIQQLMEIAQIALEDKKEFTTSFENISEVMKVSTSAGGARAKAVVGINWDTKEIRSGVSDLPEGFEHYLLKLDGVNEGQWASPQQYGRTEYAYHLMALDAKIDMYPCALLEDGDRRHFAAKRFDRDNGEKTHMLTACGMFEMDFEQQQEFSYERIIECMREINLSQKDIDQMVRRATFNVLSCNHDDHTKNFSFMMNKEGTWKLTPAYDLTFIHNEDGWNYGHQITINGEYVDLKYRDLVELAEAADCNNLEDIYDEVRSVVSNFTEYAKTADISENRVERIATKIKEIDRQMSKGLSL